MDEYKTYRTVCGVVMADGAEVVDVGEGGFENRIDTTDDETYKKTFVGGSKAFFLLTYPKGSKEPRQSNWKKDEKGEGIEEELYKGWFLFKDNIISETWIDIKTLRGLRMYTDVPVIQVYNKPFLPSGDLIC